MMKSIEIESWALRICEQVDQHVLVEDVRVEIKATWPDAVKTARRLAGHANAARGEAILWLVGADEDRGVVGANYEELSNWFSVVQSQFDDIAPSLQNLNISYHGKTVAALCFDTSRFPYVVKNSAFKNAAGGPVELETPWREGTKTRSATRSDLVLLLSPLVRIPKFEILAGDIRFVPAADGSLHTRLDFHLAAYVVAMSEAPLTIPFHKCAAVLTSGTELVSDGFNLNISTPKAKQEAQSRQNLEKGLRAGGLVSPESHGGFRAIHESIEVTADEIVIRGSGKIEIEGSWPTLFVEQWEELVLRITLAEAVTESKIVLSAKFIPPESKEAHFVWVLAK
jgi:hypothetical protein